MQKILSFLLFLGCALNAAADYKAEIFEKGTNRSKKLFLFQNTSVEKDGVAEVTTTYTEVDGTPIIIEKAMLQGIQVLKMEYSQKQMNQTALIEVKGDRVFFSKTVDGITKTTDEKLSGKFVISTSFSRFVKDNWSDITSGKKVSFRYGSWERMETIGFEIFKVSTGKIRDQDVVEVKMKPSSFIISALVDPLIFHFSADGSRIVEMVGRVAPKRKDGNKWKDLDAEVVYSY